MMRTLKVMTLGLVVLALGGVALHADTLSLGANYVTVGVKIGSNPTTEGGGSVGPSSLNGTSLPWVYCVDLYDNISVPGTYNATVTHDASMTGLTNDGLGLTGGVVNNAAQVAYLLQTYAAGATTADQQAALQAAIWYEIYNGNVTLNDNANRTTYYNMYLTGVGAGNVGHFSWLSPGVWSPRFSYRKVPDGGMTLMLLGGTLIGLGTLRRRFRV